MTKYLEVPAWALIFIIILTGLLMFIIGFIAGVRIKASMEIKPVYGIREDLDQDQIVYTLFNGETGEDIGACCAIEKMIRRANNG